jgi:hypothetical protein
MNQEEHFLPQTTDENVNTSAKERDDFQASRRLRKALTLAERFKQKYHLEQQVSSELARRCDELKQQARVDKDLIEEMKLEISALKQKNLKTDGPTSPSSVSAVNSSVRETTTSIIVKTATAFSDESKSENAAAFCTGTIIRPTSSGEIDQTVNPRMEVVTSANEHKLGPKFLDQSDIKTIPCKSGRKTGNAKVQLFEHFLVVGATYEVSGAILAIP